MISQFEAMLVMDWPAEKIVAPLEFHVLEALQESVEAFEATPVTESDARWKEQIAALEGRLAFETREACKQIEVTRRDAEAETRDQMSAEIDRHISVERAEIAKVIARFDHERARYFAEVEAEIVGLTLAIAARVLHREASLDPLLLRSAVRVALDKVAGESSVTLRVPEGQSERWRDVFAAERGEDVVLVVEDIKLSPVEMVLETSVGRVELGVRAQLKEIERGFFDLLEKRPAR
jgi:flagellar assembly protein FliH